MQSRNPVLTRVEKTSAAASTTPATTTPMSMADVIVKTTVLFAVLLVFAAGAWYTNPTAPVYYGALVAAVVVGIVAAVRSAITPGLYLLYAVLEGVVLGAISKILNDYVIARGAQSGIVGEAIIGTLVTFAVMLALYSSRIITVTARFQQIMTVAIGAYAVIAVISFVFALFGAGGGFGFYGFGPLGIIFCVVGVGLAAFTLVLDFDAIEKAIALGAPEGESWRCAFGLTVTLVWLYVELLRLLAIVNNR